MLRQVYRVVYQVVFMSLVCASAVYDELVARLVSFPQFLALLVIGFFAALAYVKIRYPFWNLQPVFHTYDLYRRYCCSRPFIPVPNSERRRRGRQKFHDDVHVRTGKYLDHVDDSLTAEVADFLQVHANISDRVFYKLSPAALQASLTGHSDAVLVSTYREERGGQDPDPDAAARSPLLACMFSRPVFFHFRGQPALKVHFWDFMCVSRALKTQTQKNAVVRRLIQTHEHNQAALTPHIHVSLFRKEVDLCDGVYPCVQYLRHSFRLPHPPPPPPPLPPHCLVRTVRADNIHVLLDFLRTAPFDFRVLPDAATVLAAIRRRHLFVHYLYCAHTNSCQAFYFFRHSNIQYEDFILRDAEHFDAAADCDALHCIASYYRSASSLSPRHFQAGFLAALGEVQRLYPTFHVLWVDALSHNPLLVLAAASSSSSSSAATDAASIQCAYYFFNYVIPQSPCRAESCFLLLF